MMRIVIFLAMAVACHALPAVSAGTAQTSPTAQEKLFQEIKSWIGQQPATAADRIDILPLDARLKIPFCQDKYALSFPFSSKETVRAQCSAPEWQAYIRIAITAPRNGVLAARELPVGKLLTDADLIFGLIPGTAADIFVDRHAVIGQTLKKSLKTGAAILAQDVEDLRSVLRVTRPVKAGEALSPANYRTEALARGAMPAGAAVNPGVINGARASRDLQPGQILTTEDISFLLRIYVTKRNVEIGQIADIDTVELSERNVSEPLANFITDAGELGTSEFSRNAKAGEPVKRSDLKAAMLLRRGQTVVVSLATRSGIELTFRAEALHDARMGEQVTLKNQESGRNIQGIVTGKGAARAL